ncbi:MAG: hypothetical protein N4A53_02005 [Pelagimonas sp.]|jgi:hypothetical protein|nr:hypothetical protein [Pelagimonas sp.]
MLKTKENRVLERTLTGLDVPGASQERARELGKLGYMQWLSALPGQANYEAEAVRAYLMAMDFADAQPPVAEFCRLIRQSLRSPLMPLDLSLPKPRRRGGARERRMSL